MEQKKVLIVDNSKIIHAFLKKVITPFKYTTLHARTLREAQKQLAEHSGIDVALVAMDLPEETEETVNLVVKAQIPTILLSGIEEEEARQKLIKKEIIDYTGKETKEDFSAIVKLIRRLETNQREKILVVDDSKTIRLFIAGLLKRHRFVPLTANDGQEALEVLKENPDIKLIITDYEMPGMDGLGLIQNTRKRFDASTLPIIVISSVEDKSTIITCLKNGANDYLHKPFEPEEFFSRLYINLSNKENIDAMSHQTKLLEKYKQTIDQSTIVCVTDESGLITHVSDAFVNVSGYTEQELIGRPESVFRHPDTPESFYSELWGTIRSGKTWIGELKNRKKDGGYFWVKATISIDKDDQGRTTGYSAIFHDITSKKALEELSKTLEERVAREVEKNKEKTTHMVQQSRLAQMGEMISMIAHQWRQPLASISAISGTLTLDVMMDEYKKEFFQERLDTITELAQHLSSTIDDFRGFFKETKEKVTTNWKELAEGSLKIIGPTLTTKDITLHTNYENTDPVITHPNEVKQVVLNILKNAEDIFLEKETEEAQIWVRSYEADGMACLSIEDNAGGIPEEIMDKIFDPYFSTKKQKDGTGLGLYMSKTIIEEHCGGSFSARNTERGALFEVALPLDKGQ